MGYMHATEENYETCKEIIRLLHKRGISLAQSYAILDYVKVKIAQDTACIPTVCKGCNAAGKASNRDCN